MTAAHAHELPPEPGELILTSEEVAAVERDGKIVILTRDGRPLAKVHATAPRAAQLPVAKLRGDGISQLSARSEFFGA